MATYRFILGIICLVGTIGNGLPDRNRISGGTKSLPTGEGWAGDRHLIVELAQSQIGIREVGGNNHGKEVASYLAYTHLPQGNPWCAALVSWVYGKAGFAQPRTAWSPALFPNIRLTKTPKPADVFGIYFPKLKRIAHCGLVENTKSDWVITIEGNTNVAGSNDGDGVYRKCRHRRTIAVYANWLKQKGGKDE